jgi:hypothetical protein
MKMPYCSTCTIGENNGPSHAMTKRQRIARVVAAAGWLGLGWLFLRIPFSAVSWPLMAISAWFGLSHLVAGCTGYPDCPELGAIASLVTRRYVRTRCGPWERIDQRLGREGPKRRRETQA